ncbi:MAG: thiamine-phosphate pyrophosphorylase [Actinomycetia bacterium]|nr:thiamine-phosphate pyrophosphorylase [Actinomycetes bacterium]
MDGTTRRARLARSRLYLVLEARPHGLDPSSLLAAALGGGVDIVQLRDKELSDDELVAAAEPFRRACEEYGALFVLNDRPDLVERCGADGVHVGQGDASAADARRLVGADRIVGLSASTSAELAAAEAEADYLGVGAVFGTPTKPDAETGGLELLRVARDTVRIPWFAIGGVDLDTVGEIATAGAPGVAVVRAIRDAADPEAAAWRLRAELPPGRAIVTGPGETVRAILPQVELLEATIGPGETGALPHTHRVHADVFYVLEGELEFRVGDETVRVPAGSCVGAPQTLVHGFRNPGDVPARYLNLHAPGVFARGRFADEPPAHYDTFGTGEGSPDARAVGNGPGDGDRLRKEHRLALVKAVLPELDVLEYYVSPDYDGASKHVHLRHADCFYVLEGELELRVDDKIVRAGPGTSVVVPPGVPHEFTSVGHARFLNVHAPECGFVEYLGKVDAGESVEPRQYDMHELA